ncbi:MAG: hypothetical protein ACE5J2_02340 [Nitrososphaerales archaeon]
MRFAKLLALTTAVLLIVSAVAITFPVQAQGNIKTEITLGTKKSDNPSATSASGDPDSALPRIVRVGEVHLVYGRLLKIEGKSAIGGLADTPVKLIDVFNNAQNPVVLATATTDKEGFFVFEWHVQAKEFKQLGVYKLQEGIGSTDSIKLQVLAKYDGDDNYASSTSRGFKVDLRPLRFMTSVSTDKQLYAVDEIAKVTLTFKDPKRELIDPDLLEVFFDSTRISPTKLDVGTYFFVTPSLTENIHSITILADKEEYLRETISATVTASPKVDVPVAILVMLDQHAYGIGDFVELAGDVRPAFVGRAILFQVTNPNGITYEVGQTFANEDGTFKHEFKLGGSLAVLGRWSITTTYLGQQTMSTFDVGRLQTKFIRITVELPETIDDQGDTARQGSVGRPLGIQAKLINNENREAKLTYILKVTDAHEVTVVVSWIKGVVLKPGVSMKPAIFWIPELKGNYTIDIFVWDDLDNPIPLSAPAKLKIGVL